MYRLCAVALGLLAAVIAVAPVSQAEAPITAPTLVAHWTDYVGADMDIDDFGIGTLAVYTHTGPAEHALMSFVLSTDPSSTQGTVLYDTGLLYRGEPAGTPAAAGLFESGDPLTASLNRSDVLSLSDETTGQMLVLCGPLAPKQNPPPRSEAETASCAAVSGP